MRQSQWILREPDPVKAHTSSLKMDVRSSSDSEPAGYVKHQPNDGKQGNATLGHEAATETPTIYESHCKSNFSLRTVGITE